MVEWAVLERLCTSNSTASSNLASSAMCGRKVATGQLVQEFESRTFCLYSVTKVITTSSGLLKSRIGGPAVPTPREVIAVIF